MPLRDPFYHPLFLSRRSAPETPPFDPFPPSGRKPWKADPKPRRDLEFHVRHYKVALEVDLDRKELRGHAALTVEAIRDGLREVAIDAAGLEVGSVAVGGRRLSYETEGEKLRVALPRPLRVGKRAMIRSGTNSSMSAPIRSASRKRGTISAEASRKTRAIEMRAARGSIRPF